MDMLWVVIVVVSACLAGSAPARQCPPAGNITRYWDGAVGQCSKCSGPACRTLNPTPSACTRTCCDMFPDRTFVDDEGRSCGPTAKPTTGVMPTESPDSGKLIPGIVAPAVVLIAVGMALLWYFNKKKLSFKKKLSKAENEHGDAEEYKPLNIISDTSMPSAINLAGRDVQNEDQTIPKDFPEVNTLVIDQPSGGLDEDPRLHHNMGSYDILKNGKEDTAGIKTTDNQAT